MKKTLKDTDIIGRCVYLISKILRSSLRITIDMHPAYDRKKQYLFAFWHGKQFLPVTELICHKTFRGAMVSPSWGGDMITVYLKKYGYHVLRGSSVDNSVRVLASMIKKLRKKFSLGFGIDGPAGPIYIIKPGMTYLSQKCEIPIIPIGSAFSSKWVLSKAWDHFQIPKPFSKSAFVLGKPIYVPKSANLEEFNQILSIKMHQAELKAMKML